MQLSAKHQAKINEKLNEVWKEQRCDICGNSEWGTSSKLQQLVEYQSGESLTARSVIPLVPIICTVCGNTRLFNAVILGIIDQATGELADG